MGNKSFREKGLGTDGKWTIFFRIFGLTAIIILVALIVTMTSQQDEKPAESTTDDAPQTTQTVQTTSTSETTTSVTTTTTTAITTTTTAEPIPLAPTDEEMEEVILKKYITINPYSRAGRRRSSTLKIVVHYVANPGSTADQNWSYFNGLARSHVTSASSNFIIGLDGEIIQCMPIYEIAYANAPINDTSISIECCHPTNDGHLNQETYDSLVKLVSWLLSRYGLSRNDVIRHYDVSGKMCPLYWAGDEGSQEYERWKAFKEDLILNK